MADERHHIDEIAHFTAAAVLPPIDDQAQVALRKLPLQSIHDGQRRIVRIADAEDHLKLRVRLIAE
jgi:hypothetical protein